MGNPQPSPTGLTGSRDAVQRLNGGGSPRECDRSHTSGGLKI